MAAAPATTSPPRTFIMRRMLIYERFLVSEFLLVDESHAEQLSGQRAERSRRQRIEFDQLPAAAEAHRRRSRRRSRGWRPAPADVVGVGLGAETAPRWHFGSINAVAVAVPCMLPVSGTTDSPTVLSVFTVTVNRGGTGSHAVASASFFVANASAAAQASPTLKSRPSTILFQSAGFTEVRSSPSSTVSLASRPAARAAASAAPCASLRVTDAWPMAKRASAAKSKPATITT